ncbi:MAG: hypothetical protein IJZ57_07400 [Clostridia bacterium]|nr:hypothetical protein [Clostridia bacterium]
MKIKIIALLIALCVIGAALSGAQLKKPESENKSTIGDRLIGTVITTEGLNTFDMEAYLNENIDNIVKDENHTVNTEDKHNYNNKIYARQVIKEDITEDGKKTTHKEYVFDDIDGFWIFDAKIPSTETEESYTCLCSEGGISNVNSKVHHTDNGVEEIELTADIYYSYEKWGTVFYMNPVYQESDGDIYCVEGMGYAVSGDKGSIDGTSSGSQTLSDKITINDNGEEIVYQSKVTINYIPVYVPSQIEFIFMNEDNKAIKEETFKPENAPEELTVPKGTDYVIVIEKNEEGSNADVIGKNRENAEFIAEDNDGYCSLHSVNLVW